MTRNLDATRSPMAFFGAELRRARVAAGMSQEQLGRELSFSGDLVSKVETCDRTPAPAFAAGCDRVFPHLDGLFTRLMELARRWDGPYPQWFRDWVEAERVATSLRWWEPMLVPGLLQTPTTRVPCSGLGSQLARPTIRWTNSSALASSGKASSTSPSRLSCGCS